MNIRRLRQPWIVAVLSVLGVLVLAEGLFRLAPVLLPFRVRQNLRDQPQRTTVAHPYIGHLNKPGRESDPFGFRNRWPWPDAPPIVTLGDSVTLGPGVDAASTWPAVLDRMFSEQSVVNLALGAAGPQQYLRVFETFGAGLGARLVLIGFFGGNDFWDAAMFERWVRSGAGGNYLVWRDNGRPADVRLSLRRPVGRLVRASLWRGELLTRTTYVGSLALYASGKSEAWPSSRAARMVYQAPDGTRLELEPHRLLRQIRLSAPEGHVFPRVLESLERIRDLAREKGGNTLVVLLPSREDVYLPMVGSPDADATATLRSALEQRGIPWLDLGPAFRRAAAEGEALFLPTESPLLSARGHALTARLLTSSLGQGAAPNGR